MATEEKPTGNFLIAVFATVLELYVAPMYFVMRSNMGIQQTGLIGFLSAILINGAFLTFAAVQSAALAPDGSQEMAARWNAVFLIVYLALIGLGYLRNWRQAARRRRLRDWSVGSNSLGESLAKPVMVFFGRRACRRAGNNPAVVALFDKLLQADVIYYWIEPGLLVALSLLLRTTQCPLWDYPVSLAMGLIVVRHHAHLYWYLRAHAIPDGKRTEETIKTELAGPISLGGACTASVPEGPLVRPATDGQSVFDRLSPELQALLRADRSKGSRP